MPPPSTPYGELRAFAEVARQGSFAAAARSLGLTPSALSQAVRALERRLGLSLLHRTTRSMSLTDGGRHLLAEIRPGLDRLDAAVARAQAGASRPAGTVRLVSPRYAFWERIEPRLATFAARYPEVVLDITVDDALTDIVAHGYDLGVRLGENLDPETVAIPLGGPLRQIAVATPAYVQEHGKPHHPYELRRHRCLNWRKDGQTGAYEWEFGKEGRLLTLAVAGPLVVNDRRATLMAALAGMGIALCMQERAAPYLRDGRLVTLLEDWALSFEGFFVFYYRRRFMSPAVRALLAELRSPSPGPVAPAG